MSINIILNGAHGKMGKTVAQAIVNEPDLQLLAGLDHQDDLKKELKKYHPDIVIDFTTPQTVFDNANTIIECGVRPVIGTTGLLAEQIKKLEIVCKQKSLGGIIAPNFSIGAILMMRFSEMAACYFSDVEIVEMHHPQKRDAPSGTAQKTAELIANNKKQKNASAPIDATLKNNMARGKSHCDIPIHAMRLSGAFARQSVVFGNSGELLTIQHDALDRNAMMPGLFLCCRKVMQLNHLVYGIEKLI